MQEIDESLGRIEKRCPAAVDADFSVMSGIFPAPLCTFPLVLL